MSTSSILWGLLFGSIGLGFLIYGRKQRAVVPLKTLELKIDGIPPTVSIQSGELRIQFSGADDLFRQLFELAQAMKNDYERFKALAGE